MIRRRRADRSSSLVSAKYTRVMISSYDKDSPAVTISRGVFLSATWGK
jgi:hypothetical protein